MSGAQPLEPGSTIGMLGGGQLGRMFAMAAHSLGYHVIVFDSTPDGPGVQVSDDAVIAPYDDEQALRAFAARCDVVTLEWENIPVDSVTHIAEVCPVFPDASILRIAQDRRLEKDTLANFGLPVTPFLAIESQAELSSALQKFGLPMVLKTARSGYDGKGQTMARSEDALWKAFEKLNGFPAVAEKWIDYRRELSVIVARTQAGRIAVYPLFENHHENHILDATLFPAPNIEHLVDAATELATRAAEALQLVGVLCVELFESNDGKLLINEIAPRPHNSGHVTIEAAETSQFEQHVRAICNLPLGSTEVRKPGAMVNLLGDLWQSGKPNFVAAIESPETHLHLYGKHEARVGRKMGHLTVLAESTTEASDLAKAARERMQS